MNKYSIRRFTVGTASILVGATLVFGISNNEAQAAEKTSTEESTQSNEDTSSQDSVKQKVMFKLVNKQLTIMTTLNKLM